MNPIDGLEEELEEISADTNFILNIQKIHSEMGGFFMHKFSETT